MIEVSGLWRNPTGESGVAVTAYCSPGPWSGGLDPDEWEGESVYLEYEPVFAVFNLSSNALSEYSLGDDPLRHHVLEGSDKVYNRMGESWGDEWPKRTAGYASDSDRVFLWYRHYNDGHFRKMFLLSPVAGTVLATSTALGVVGQVGLWAGDLIAFSAGKMYRL